MTSELLLLAALFCGASDTQPSTEGNKGQAPREMVLQKAPSAKSSEPVPYCPAFFAMDTATKDANHQTVESQLRMVKELGFAGWACNLPEATEANLRLMDDLGLQLFAIYTGLEISGKQPPWDPRLPETIQRLKGRKTLIWLFVTGQGYTPGSDTGDEKAVELIRQVAKMTADAGLGVSLYPHNGFYAASTRDALRLVRKVYRPNVSLTFNLCHWLKVDRGQGIDEILRDAMPDLSVVSINGADNEGTEWDRLIQPLGRGDFNVCDLLMRLQGFGYKGPVGLQGYGIKGDVHEHLSLAMRTWSEYGRRIAQSSRMGDETYAVRRVASGAITIDGQADEPAWAEAKAENGFTFPWKKSPSPTTEFRAVCDGENLYVTFRVKDDDIVVLDKLRDEEDEVFEDRVELYFARDDALRSYYCLEIDSRGRVFDYHGAYYRQISPRWNCPGVEAAGSSLPSGYVVEASIPLASLEELGFDLAGVRDKRPARGRGRTSAGPEARGRNAAAAPSSAAKPLAKPGRGSRIRCGLYRAEFSHDRSGKPVEQRETIHNRGRRLDGPPPIEEWISWVDPKTPEPDFHVPSSFGWMEIAGKPRPGGESK